MKKRYFITGVCGSIGKEIAKNLLSQSSENIVVGVDINETEIHFINNEYQALGNFSAYYCDIRDSNELEQRSLGSEIFIHAAALKHVPICEVAPNQAISVNIIGVQNCIKAANVNHFEKFVFTSSDKAVNPTSVMGTSKLMGERLVTSASQYSESKCKFSSTRFGNVVGSRGSVIPIFKGQIDCGANLTLTDQRMTRFLMSQQEAADLVLRSIDFAENGDVIVIKMPVARISDIAKLFLEKAGREPTEIDIIGLKPGEKLYEELNNSEEANRTIDCGEFLRITPALTQPLTPNFNQKIYNSDSIPPVSYDELADLFQKWKIF